MGMETVDAFILSAVVLIWAISLVWRLPKTLDRLIAWLSMSALIVYGIIRDTILK